MAVKDRSKPIRHIPTGTPAMYCGESRSLGIKRHVIQLKVDRTLVTAWLTDEDFEAWFENVPQPHETNGKSQPDIDWAGEVECCHRFSIEQWEHFNVLSYSDKFPDVVYGAFDGHKHPGIYPLNRWEFRNKPEPKWESAGDDRSCHEMDTGLWQVWAQYPDGHKGIKFPFVVHTGKSRIAGLGFLINLRDGGAFPPGMRFALAPCKAPKMPEAVEAE